MSLENINQKRLRSIAKMLPPLTYVTRERVEIKGEDLLLSGQKEVEGKAIEPEKVYVMSAPVYNEANHYRRLKRAFLANKKKGVTAYLKPYVREPKALAGIMDAIFPEEEKLIKRLGVQVKS